MELLGIKMIKWDKQDRRMMIS
jgi:hypothetical protein